jgi:hypothetical protein
MLKSRVGDRIWLVTQPDHAAVSGYLAAHWGNQEFRRPGYYTGSPQADRWRAETVLAIAEHDNGWWEWEADPEIDPADALPLNLLGLSQEQGLERWRLGVPRFEERHPWVALLISYHAYWLHAHRAEPGHDPVFRHPLFGSPGSWPEPSGEELDRARKFLAEQRRIQEALRQRLREQSDWADAVEPAVLHPAVRLLQLADALSLALCFGAGRNLALAEIPRKSWDDRVTLQVRPIAERRLLCNPYPFAFDPLRVAVPVRILETAAHGGSFHGWWQGITRDPVVFEYSSSR